MLPLFALSRLAASDSESVGVMATVFTKENTHQEGSRVGFALSRIARTATRNLEIVIELIFLKVSLIVVAVTFASSPGVEQRIKGRRRMVTGHTLEKNKSCQLIVQI